MLSAQLMTDAFCRPSDMRNLVPPTAARSFFVMAPSLQRTEGVALVSDEAQTKTARPAAERTSCGGRQEHERGSLTERAYALEVRGAHARCPQAGGFAAWAAAGVPAMPRRVGLRAERAPGAVLAPRRRAGRRLPLESAQHGGWCSRAPRVRTPLAQHLEASSCPAPFPTAARDLRFGDMYRPASGLEDVC